MCTRGTSVHVSTCRGGRTFECAGGPSVWGRNAAINWLAICLLKGRGSWRLFSCFGVHSFGCAVLMLCARYPSGVYASVQHIWSSEGNDPSKQRSTPVGHVRVLGFELKRQRTP